MCEKTRARNTDLEDINIPWDRNFCPIRKYV